MKTVKIGRLSISFEDGDAHITANDDDFGYYELSVRGFSPRDGELVRDAAKRLLVQQARTDKDLRTLIVGPPSMDEVRRALKGR